MTLLQQLRAALSWRATVAGGADEFDGLSLPYLGVPWDHGCDQLRSRSLSASVVVPNWNSTATLGWCLKAIELSSLNRLAPERLEVIVCDDGSTDSSPDLLREQRFTLNLQAFGLPHRGQSAALNVGIQQASSEVLVFCDSDMLLGCGALDELLTRHEAWEHCLCFGFRSDVQPSLLPWLEDQRELWRLLHREAISGDNRVAFHMPSLVPNRLEATAWLAKLQGDDMLLDCEGQHWWRHRFVYGCLFSARRTLMLEQDGFPDALQSWGYNDALLAARSEAAGAFLLPVPSAWGHHVRHELRHPNQWFQGSRNAIAHRYLLQAKDPAVLWRQRPDETALPVTLARSTAVPMVEREPMRVLYGAQTYRAIGDWERCLAAPCESGGATAEALFRLGRYDELAAEREVLTVWHVLGLARLGDVAAARKLLVRAALSDPSSSYLASASPAELLALAENYDQVGLTELASLHREALALVWPG